MVCLKLSALRTRACWKSFTPLVNSRVDKLLSRLYPVFFFRIWNMGGVNQPLGVPPFPSPFPSPPLPSPPLSPLPLPSHPLPLEVGPLFAARGLGERLSSPSGSGRSPAAKRFLVLFELKILHLVRCCLDQVE